MSLGVGVSVHDPAPAPAPGHSVVFSCSFCSCSRSLPPVLSGLQGLPSFSQQFKALVLGEMEKDLGAVSSLPSFLCEPLEKSSFPLFCSPRSSALSWSHTAHEQRGRLILTSAASSAPWRHCLVLRVQVILVVVL